MSGASIGQVNRKEYHEKREILKSHTVGVQEVRQYRGGSEPEGDYTFCILVKWK